MFHVIPDAAVVTCTNGIYRQHEVYKYKDRVFIKSGTGYAWIMKSGDTSIPKMRVDELVLPFKEEHNKLGYLMVPKDQ